MVSLLPYEVKRLVWNWRELSAVRSPFAPHELDYIKRLDPVKDGQILREKGIEEEAIFRMQMATLILTPDCYLLIGQI